MRPGSDSETSHARRSHLGRLLFELTRHFEIESLRRLHAMGHARLTQAQKQSMVHLPTGGGRLTDVANRAGVTKQTMMRLVDGLEAQGYVRRTMDPADARAKFVNVTAKGKRLLDDGLVCVKAIESEYQERIGDAAFATLREHLRDLAVKLALQFPDGRPDDEPAPPRARPF